MLYGNLQSSELVLIRETIQVGFVSYSEALLVYCLEIRFSLFMFDQCHELFYITLACF